MEEKLVTLAILTFSKAQILKSVLESEGIDASIHNVNLIQPVISSGVRVRIKESDLPHALKIIESAKWLSSEILDEKSSEESAPPRRVLVPVDFSAYSLKACDAAFHIAANLKAEVVLLHVYFSPIHMPSLQYVTDGYHIPPFASEAAGMRELATSTHQQIDQLTKQVDANILSGVYPKVKYSCLLREGIPEEEILRYAKSKRPLLVVMGTRGESQKDLDLIGSVTAEVIDRCPVFVYAIPENAPAKVLETTHKVALITNFDQRDLMAFDALIRTFSTYHFSVSFVHLNTKENRRTWNEIKLAGIKEYFQKQYPQLDISYSLIDEDHLLNHLDEYVRSEQIDVLCITNYKRNIFAQLFNPSIARRMVFHSDTPILVIK